MINCVYLNDTITGHTYVPLFHYGLLTNCCFRLSKTTAADVVGHLLGLLENHLQALEPLRQLRTTLAISHYPHNKTHLSSSPRQTARTLTNFPLSPTPSLQSDQLQDSDGHFTLLTFTPAFSDFKAITKQHIYGRSWHYLFCVY